MYMNWSDWHWGFGAGHWIFGILFWVVILLLFVGLVRGISGFGRGGREIKNDARRILEERYARGEIDREEFEQKKRDLG